MTDQTTNLNPNIKKVEEGVDSDRLQAELNSLNAPELIDEIDVEEVYDIIRHIKDPEHPNTLEELEVVHTRGITIDTTTEVVRIEFTPTIPGCGMATLIGLMIKVKCHRSLPENYKVDVYIEKGKHSTEDDINKQLNDKERAYAALENP